MKHSTVAEDIINIFNSIIKNPNIGPESIENIVKAALSAYVVAYRINDDDDDDDDEDLCNEKSISSKQKPQRFPGGPATIPRAFKQMYISQCRSLDGKAIYQATAENGYIVLIFSNGTFTVLRQAGYSWDFNELPLDKEDKSYILSHIPDCKQ